METGYIDKYNDANFAYVRKYVDGLRNIYLVAKESYEIAYVLYNPLTTLEHDYIRRNLTMHFIRQTIWRACVMEVAKLCNDKEAFSLSKLIRKMKDGDFRKLNLNKTKIAKWEHTLSENAHLINNIVTLRNKVIVHTDINKIDLQGVAFSEVYIFLNIANEMITEIHYEVFEAHIDLNHAFENKITILEELAANRERKMQGVLDQFKNYQH